MMYRCYVLLFCLSFAPACAPTSDDASEKEAVIQAPLVLLTDPAAWEAEDLRAYRDSLEAAHYRVLVSGFSNETPQELVARLPWLLQPGVSLFIYDEALAGPAGGDSLRVALKRLKYDAPVVVLQR